MSTGLLEVLAARGIPSVVTLHDYWFLCPVIHLVQRDNRTRISCEARLQGRRAVRNSGGNAQMRFVIVTEVILGGQSWPIEVTLTNRDQMGFRMLLGRATVRGRFVVDPSTSYRGKKSNADGRKNVQTGRHAST